jgi:uncharacterized protein with PQ loop repeat
MDDPLAANALGIAGAVCWSIQLLPQILLNYRRHNATGLQPTMMLLWAFAGVLLGVYNIVSNFNIALQIQPQILCGLSLITWIQCYYYEHHWTTLRCMIVILPVAGSMAGLEVGLIFALRAGMMMGITWPVTLIAVLAALFLALGVLRHYLDIWQHRTVRGISFLFVGLDALGDLTSLISLVFEPELDVLGMVIYGVELVLWLGIFACGGYYNLMPWLKNREIVNLRSHAVVGEDVSHYNNTVVLHDLPSSTSVFRTPSSDMQLRERVAAASADSAPMVD